MILSTKVVSVKVGKGENKGIGEAIPQMGIFFLIPLKKMAEGGGSRTHPSPLKAITGFEDLQDHRALSPSRGLG